MLLREDEDGTLAIGQQSHAWLSGQLARAWGNERFGVVHPLEEVCLAAEQHDVGWGDWDGEPILNRERGLPCSFMEIPLGDHLSLFTEGPRRLVTQSRYAALLTSLHGWRLYERRDLEHAPAQDAVAIRRFLDGQRAFQRELLDTLRADPATAAVASEELVRRNSMLIWTWDYLSLALCLRWAPATARRTPAADGEVDLEIRDGHSCGRFQLDPWPLSSDLVTLRCEGRRIHGPFRSRSALRDALELAPWETLEFELARSG